MKKAMDVTEQRRLKQQAYNEQHGITPTTIRRAVTDVMDTGYRESSARADKRRRVAEPSVDYNALSAKELDKLIKKMEQQMYQHAQNLEFEEAAQIRDRIQKIQAQTLINL